MDSFGQAAHNLKDNIKQEAEHIRQRTDDSLRRRGWIDEPDSKTDELRRRAGDTADRKADEVCQRADDLQRRGLFREAEYGKVFYIVDSTKYLMFTDRTQENLVAFPHSDVKSFRIHDANGQLPVDVPKAFGFGALSSLISGAAARWAASASGKVDATSVDLLTLAGGGLGLWGGLMAGGGLFRKGCQARGSVVEVRTSNGWHVLQCGDSVDDLATWFS